MQLQRQKPSKNEAHFDNCMPTIPSKPPDSHWCLARNAVYLFVARMVVRSRSHTIVNIGSDSTTSTLVGSAQKTTSSFDDQHSHFSITKEKDSYCDGSHCPFAQVTTFLRFVLKAVKSIPTAIQIMLAILSIGFGIKFHGHRRGWYDGGGILISVFVTVLVSAIISTKYNQALNNPINTCIVDDHSKPLQAQVEKISSNIMKLGLLVTFLLLLVLSIRSFVHHGSHQKFNNVMDAIMKILSAVITIGVISKSEGLMLAVTLTVSHAMEKMLENGILIRKLSIWEDVGSITVICTDKTGTLQMVVTELWVGKEKVKPCHLAPNVVKLLQEAVGLNNRSSGLNTSIVNQSTFELTHKVFGSHVEKAIFDWGVNDLGVKMDEINQSFEDLKVEAFDSEKRRSGVMARRKTDNTIHVYFKGAAEVILAECSNYYDQKGMCKVIADEDKNYFRTIIQDMGVKGLTCIAFAQNQEEGDVGDNNVMHQSEKEHGSLTLLGIIGLTVLCQTGVQEAVELCRNAGVGVKLITEDNKSTATEIGFQCGILKPNSHELHEDAVIEGTRFRNYSDQERLEKVDHIQIMASSCVQDKLLLVQCLKQKQHIVAITCANSDEAPALEEANVGVALGIESTEDVKQSSDIVILRGTYFASIVTMIKWGRCGYANIQKVIQVQLTIVIVGSIVSFIGAISSGNLPPLWANILLDTLLSLALATKQPTEDDDELMKLSEQPIRIPGDQRTIVSKVVWRNAIGQTLYQVTILLILKFEGQSTFGIGEEVQDTLIFNCFLLCQVFNLFNARKLEKKNIFEGITLESKTFWLVVGITVIVQIFMVELFCTFASTERLNWGQWAACVGVAAFSWPMGWLIKCTTIQFGFCLQNILHPLQNDLPITSPCVSRKDFKWGEQFKSGRIITFLRPIVLFPFF